MLPAANWQLAFSLYLAVAAEQGGNLVVLPFSCALSLLLNGADAETRREVLQTIGFTGSSLEEIDLQTHTVCYCWVFNLGIMAILSPSSSYYHVPHGPSRICRCRR